MDTEQAQARDSYDGIAKLLHWLIAGAIVLQFVLAKMAERAEDDGSKFRELVLLANHKSVGITILALAVVRLAWRLYRSPPAPLPMPDWQRIASSVSHWGFYLLLFAMPISGWLMSSASNVSVSWFNLFQLPDFVAPGESTEELFEGIHETLAKVLLLLALLHVAAAIKHTVFDRDGALQRISSPLGLVLFVLIIAAGILTLIPEARAQNTAPQSWTIDYAKSHIRFTAEQAGADFDGEWNKWQADIRFDTNSLDMNSFDVAITVAGVDTLDQERDETLLDREFFDGENFPLVHYRAHDFTRTRNDTLLARGMLEVKGASTPVELEFTISEDGDRVVLTGTATLDRLILNVGIDEWADTAWIGQYVDVSVHVEATP